MSKGFVLLLDVCSQPLHNLEFVRPIEDILRQEKRDFRALRCNQLDKKSFEECEAVIICGTSLLDQGYLDDLDFFVFLKECEKPILGICAGMQILVKLFGGSLVECLEIGLTKIILKTRFFGLEDEVEVYELHQYSTVPDESIFEIIAKNPKGAQIIAHKKKPIVGCMFHPEVRNKDFIIDFLKNKT